MAAVGVKASDTKRQSGCQNQKCEKTPIPTMAGMILLPVRLVSAIVTLRPPASSRPVATMAPNLVFAVLGLARLRLVVRVLHKDHRRGQQRALPHVVDRVGQHRSEQIERFLGSRAGARDADGEGRAVAHVRVVRLGQQLDHARALRRRVGQHKPDCDDGGAPHIVRHIRDGHVQAGAQRRVGAGAGVGKGDGVHGAVAENRVRLVQQRERDADGQAANDLLVRRVMRVAEHLFDRLGRGRAQHDQTHRERGRLARHGRVVEEHALELLVQIGVLRPHHCDPDAKGAAVLHDLVGAGVAQRVEQVGADAEAVVGVDDAEREERAALRVGRGRHARLRQVGREQRERLLDVPAVDHAERGRGRKLGPVGGAREPFEVVPQKGVGGGAGVHDGVCQHDGRV
eukprot:scaffold10117_cov111-Isochrysis_galbana.AAC.5